MTAPIWMASPPEVHSALLSSGPGPGPLLASAGAWNSLSAEYASVAEELSASLAEVQAGVWEGPSAESYVAAHVPYLAWLTQASANSAEMAVKHETVAAAYTGAVAAMPTLAELAANHAVHGVLLATNFFGINTIPITLNEADYVRMWAQAALTMATYQAVSSTALASMSQTPQTTAAPQILKSGASADPASSASDVLQEGDNLLQGFWQGFLQQVEQFLQNPLGLQQQIADVILNNGQTDNPLGLPQGYINFLQSLGISNGPVAHDPTIDNAFDNFLAPILQHFGINWDPAGGTINGATYDSYTNPGQASFWVARSLELTEDFENFTVDLRTNPVAAFQYLFSWEFFDIPTHIGEVLSYAITNPAVAVATLPALSSAGAVGLAGLAGLTALPQPVVAPALAAPALLPVVGVAPTFIAPAAAPATAPAPSPTPSSPPAPAGPAPAPPPTAAGGSGFIPPYVVGPPRIGAGSGLSSSASSSAKRKAPEAGGVAAAAAAATRGAARARRRQRARQRGYGDEFMDMNVEVDPDWGVPGGEAAVSTTASDQGAGNLGFAGTARKEAAGKAAGLATLAGDEFGGGPRMPMMPGTWDPGSGAEGNEEN
ncbi:MAG: PPE family protein [Mycobacterium sp.]|jgi:PPE-repeat protein